MRKLVLGTALALSALTAVAATPAAPAPKASPAVAAKPGAKPAKAFGLTQSLAVLFACPDARFDNANVIALGGVVRENKKRIDAAPVSARMDLMGTLVAEETAKAQNYVKTHKVDCIKDVQPAAAYWNSMITSVAAEQGAEPPATPAVPATPQPARPVVPRNTEPVSGLQLP